MPKTLKRATTVLALAALTWMITSGLLSLLAAALTADTEAAEGIRLRSEDTDPPVIVWIIVIGVVQMALCLLTRSGRSWARVLLTCSAALVSLMLLITVVHAAVTILDATAAGEGWQLPVPGIVLVVIDAFALTGTVLGLVGLYRPSVNAYFAEIRRQRPESLTS
ncbi:hypothetical protein [Amycolatopsis japonica]|uniref:hypothetical protein n=1 Tax=Amycolatopsis japonica TaxID=208439 RepID=UPI0038138921